MLVDVTGGAVLAGPGLVLGTALVAHLLLLQPVLGARKLARLRRDLAAEQEGESGAPGPGGARLRFYGRTLAMQAALLAAVLASLAASPRLGLAGGLVAAGVRPPDAAGPAAAVAVAVVVAFGVLPVVALRRAAAARDRSGSAAAEAPLGVTDGDAPALLLVPRHRRERALFGALAVTAGVVEELLSRGFALLWLASVAPDMPVWAAVVLTAAAFGLGHAYQRLAGVVVTALLGAAFAVLYVGTDSLLAPAVLHAAVDLRVLLLARALPEPADRTGTPRRADSLEQ